MATVKKYKLRQTLLMPGMTPIILPVGYEVQLRGDRYAGEGGWIFHPHGVEDNKLHWEEVVEQPTEQPKERIEVKGFCRSGALLSNIDGVPYSHYGFHCEQLIPKEKYPKIKQAIEAILNDDAGEQKPDFVAEWVNDTLNKKVVINGVEYFSMLNDDDPQFDHVRYWMDSSLRYNKIELDEAIEKAFNAARLVRPLPFEHNVYENAKDYNQSLNQQKQ